MCSNPSVISINGVRFGLSTADIVRHLAAEELAPRTAEDRIGRLLRHVIGQQSFYPLYPAHSEVPLHLSQYARCMFEQAPHVLVFASQLAHFAKVRASLSLEEGPTDRAQSVAGVLCLNAGRVVNGAQSGTCLELHLPAHDQCAVAEQARVNLVYL
jgi:DNA polymerase alpha subunit B